MAEMTDKEAIEDMRQGGREGFQVLQQRYEGQLKEHLMSRYQIGKSLTDEICNDVFFVFKLKIKSFKEKEDVFNQLISLADRRYLIEKAVEDIRKKGRKGIAFFHTFYEESLMIFLKHDYGLDQSDAEEICNDAFCQFYIKIAQLKKNGQAVAWLRKIAENKAKKRLLELAKRPWWKRLSLSENLSPEDKDEEYLLDGHLSFPSDKQFDDDLENNNFSCFQDSIEKESCYQTCVRLALARLRHSQKNQKECLRDSEKIKYPIL